MLNSCESKEECHNQTLEQFLLYPVRVVSCSLLYQNMLDYSRSVLTFLSVRSWFGVK